MCLDLNIDFIGWNNVPDTFFSRSALAEWLNLLADDYNKKIERLCYKFCSDHEMLEMNKQFLDHDYHTDILTFPEDHTTSRKIRADILISWDRVKENALEYGVSQENELLRVMAHGLLHLVGFRDEMEEDKLIMHNAEQRAIDIWRENENRVL